METFDLRERQLLVDFSLFIKTNRSFLLLLPRSVPNAGQETISPSFSGTILPPQNKPTIKSVAFFCNTYAKLETHSAVFFDWNHRIVSHA